MTNQFTRRAFNATLAATALAPTGALAQDAALIEAAKKEGQLLWYTGLIVNLVVRPLSEGFEKKYGIKVNPVTTNDAETLLRISNEARANNRQCDVFDSPGTTIPPLTAAGLIEKYAPKSAEVFPEGMKGKDGLWTAIFALYLTTCYNTDLVKAAEAPKTYEDLLDPKWKGKIVWTGTRTISGPAGFIGNILQTMGEEKGMAYLKKLSEQKIVSLAGQNQRVVLDQVIAGQYPISLMTYNHHAVISKGQGAPVAWVKMEPLVANLGVVGIAKGAPHPNAAKLFMEYIFSEEGQVVLRNANYPPAHPKVAPKDPSISPITGQFKTTMIGPEATAAGGPLEKWLKIYDGLFA